MAMLTKSALKNPSIFRIAAYKRNNIGNLAIWTKSADWLNGLYVGLFIRVTARRGMGLGQTPLFQQIIFPLQ